VHKTDKSQYDTDVSLQELIVKALPPLRIASALSKSIALGWLKAQRSWIVLF